MNELLRFHHDFAFIAIAINLFAGCLMLTALKIVDLKRKKYFYTSVYLGWGAMVVQSLLGISLYMSGEKVDSSKGFHYFYGFLAMLIAAVLFSYRKSLGQKKILIYGLSSLFLGFMGIRTALLVLIK